MNPAEIASAFSRNRLNGEPIPSDLAKLLNHRDAWMELTEFELNWDEDWAPWLDTSYLNEADRANPDIMANVRAIADVCKLIAFVASNDESEYLGYWRGPDSCAIANSPLVILDNEGQFSSAGPTFAEACLSRLTDEDRFQETREWLGSIGIKVAAETLDDLLSGFVDSGADRLHRELYRRYKPG